MPDALFTASSRSAGCCRSRRLYIILVRRARLILPKPRHGISVRQSCVPRSNGSGTRITSLRGPQGMAAVEARGIYPDAMHCRAPDETDRHPRCGARKGGQNNDSGHFSALSARQGKPPVPGPCTEPLVSQRFYLFVHVAGLCLCGLRDRYIC